MTVFWGTAPYSLVRHINAHRRENLKSYLAMGGFKMISKNASSVEKMEQTIENQLSTRNEKGETW
jgi:hypothetical protein